MSDAQVKEQPVFKSDFLKGKKALICGVANKRSIAWGIAQALANHGCELAFTYQGDRLKENVEELAATLPGKPPLYPCDVVDDVQIQAVTAGLQKDFGRLDFLVHCLAFAKKEDISGRIIDTTRDGYKLAQEISAYSLIALSKAVEPLMEKDGGSIVALTYLGSSRVIPNYNVMGTAKAALESCIRYLAVDLGKKNIRVNGISAGPVNTLAGRGVAGFTAMLDNHAKRAPLGRNVELEEVGNAAFFLLSSLGGGITGETIYVDCGYRIMGA